MINNGVTYRNKNFKKRDYNCTNIVLARVRDADGKLDPRQEWEPAPDLDTIPRDLLKLYVQADVEYWGYL